MCYELSDKESSIIRMLPTKPRGVPRADDGRVRNGIFLAIAIGCSLAGPSSPLWSWHHLLQSLHSLAEGRHLGRDHAGPDGRALCR